MSERSQNTENNPSIEDALANRAYYRGESLSAELLAGAETPQELFVGLRSLEKQMEDGNIPGPLSERYTPPRQLAIMYERADILNIPIDTLLHQGLIRPGSYNEKSGEGTPKKRKYASLAVSVDEVPIIVRTKEGYEREVGVDLRYNFGTAESRETMAKVYERAILELEARAIIGDHISIRLNLDYRDSLEQITAAMHGGRMPKFNANHLNAIFNMPGIKELEKNPENTKLGEQVEKAMFLNLVMLRSGTKKQMIDLLERPGAKYLIAEMAKEQESLAGSDYKSKDWIKDNIGDIESWVDDEDRDLETYKKEVEKGFRKDLTKWANIAAFVGKPGDFGRDDEDAFIEQTVGGLCGSVEASWVASSLMRVIGSYSSEGYVALPNGKSSLPLGEGRFISSDDMGKFYAYMFNMKEGTKGRTSGLKDMIGKIPDMAMDLFDWAQVKVKLDDNTTVRRSIWDAWLGTTGGKVKTNLLTGEETDEKTKEEGYNRLGSLDFNSLDRDFHGTFTIMQWLMGNGERPTGVLIEALRTDFKPEDFTLNQMKKVWKYIGIVFNPVVLTRGSTHIYSYEKDPATGEESDRYTTEIIGKNFFRNLMYARIHSASFTTNLLNHTIPMFGETPGSNDIVFPLVVSNNIKIVLENSPKNEKDLLVYYADSYKTFTTLAEQHIGPAKIRTPGNKFDRIRFLHEKFIPTDQNKRRLMGFVGKVTGKKL